MKPDNSSTPKQWAQVEAYCLMRYATDDRSEEEVIWNSRDGATPFAITNRTGMKLMTHVDWHLDEQMAPDFVPPEGTRVFIDGDEDGTPRLVVYGSAAWKHRVKQEVAASEYRLNRHMQSGELFRKLHKITNTRDSR
ncbi:MAG: hypothetical protein LC754_10535 [Acidobacteria bacterium]|nr:hypothetical protein [Acidobacteriota bacterium]